MLILAGMHAHSQTEIMRKTSDNASELIFINMDEFMRGVSTSLVVKENKEVAIYYTGSSLRIGKTHFGYQKLLYDSKQSLVMAVTENDPSNMVIYGFYDNTLLVMHVKINDDGHVIVKSYGFKQGASYFEQLKKLAEPIR